MGVADMPEVSESTSRFCRLFILGIRFGDDDDDEEETKEETEEETLSRLSVENNETELDFPRSREREAFAELPRFDLSMEISMDSF